MEIGTGWLVAEFGKKCDKNSVPTCAMSHFKLLQ